MKKIILISFFVLFNSLLYGQELSLKTCFEDSQGNKDSLILGYDVLGTDTIDTIFNEQNIFNIPWNNTFEVRAGEAATSLNNLYLTSPPTIHTKKQIIFKDCNFYHLIKIAIKCKHFPLVIKWDKSVFGIDSCYYSSFITSGTGWYGDWLDGVMAFINPVNQFYRDSLIITGIGYPASTVNYIQNGDTIIQLNLSFGKEMPSTRINEEKFENAIEMYPNPTDNLIQISFKNNSFKIYQIKIFDMLGKLKYNQLTKNKNDSKIDINTSNFSNGLYNIIISCDNVVYSNKLIINK